MSYDTLSTTLAFPVGAGGSISFAYPPARNTSSYLGSGAILTDSNGTVTYQDREMFSVIYGASAVTVVYGAGPQVAAGSVSLKCPLAVEADVLSSAPSSLGALRLVASACMVSFDATTGNTVTDSRVARYEHKIAPTAVSDLRVGYHAFYLGASTGPETDLPNGFALQAALEPSGASAVAKATFGGKQAPAIDGATGIILSDPIAIDLDPSTILYSRTRATSDGAFFPPFGRRAISGSANQSRNTISSDANQVYLTGSLSVGTNPGSATAPALIIGRMQNAVPAFALITDSIGSGTGDTDQTGIVAGSYWGFLARGFQDSDGAGGIYPWVNLGKAGVDFASYATPVGSRRLHALQYCTHTIIQAGTNTLANSGTTIAQDQAAAAVIYKAARRRGCKVYQVLIMPRTDASNVPATGFAPAGKRDQFNAWCRAGASGLIDGIIDVNPAVEVGTTGTWQSVPSDGVHPTTPYHVAAAAIFNQWVRTVSY